MITGTHISYYLVCHQKLWLFANGIQMEHTSELVAEGRLIHETSYPQRSERYQELEIDGIKIDYYDARNKVIHEVKKSDKLETAHEWQLKYYIYVLERNGVEGVTAILEYPKLRRTTLLPGIGSGRDLQAYAGRSPDLQVGQQTGNPGETF
ncbi:MAG: Dna2/Cas4 domain-containing protein [Bacteroidetes bacterium]|nr:MAG: Dna2/Cas4 domain-containing protein [Bacteroidota bacterium]